ncbi:MAG: glycoside hydrolase family 97 protein [Chitinophagales bacterium]
MHQFFMYLALFLSTLQVFAQDIVLQSPDKQTSITIVTEGELAYKVQSQGQTLLASSPISMTLRNGTVLGGKPTVKEVSTSNMDTLLKPLYGISNTIQDTYEQVKIDFQGNYSLYFRAYNNAIAYRFETHFEDSITIQNEQATFNFGEAVDVYFSEVEDFQNPFEGHYQPISLSKLSSEQYTFAPTLINKKNNLKLLIAEADLLDYPGLFLTPDANKAHCLAAKFASYVTKSSEQFAGRVGLVQAPYFSKMMVRERANYIAKVAGKRTFPWRVILFGEDQDLITNTVVYQLASSSKIKNTDWIKTGKTVWDWYHFCQIETDDFKAGNNNATFKYYIDFAAENNFEFVNIDYGWSKTRQLDQAKRKVDVPELVQYATEKEVGIFLWVMWHPLAENLTDYLDLFAAWGVKGLKVDFMDRNDQGMVRFVEKLAIEAAKRNLLLNLHGVYPPTGLSRTYPNIVNYEAVLGLENNKFNKHCTPKHNLSIPFIRMPIGAMDYTPGGMVHTPEENFEENWKRPSAMTTRCQQMAMYVVYYGPIQMVSDVPSYYPIEVLQFLQKVPSTWEETRVLKGKVGEYLVLARRKGKKWFIAGMTNEKRREFTIDLSFLNQGDYSATLWHDGATMEEVIVETMRLNNKSKFNVSLAEAGGFILLLEEE